MPHVIVKLWPGKSDAKKQELADAIARDVMGILNYGEESVSVSFEEINAADWMEKVFAPDIAEKREQLFKRPGYGTL